MNGVDYASQEPVWYQARNSLKRGEGQHWRPAQQRRQEAGVSGDWGQGGAVAVRRAVLIGGGV